MAHPGTRPAEGGDEIEAGGAEGWDRDYFGDAHHERAHHKVTTRELDELCYIVGLLVATDGWPPRAGTDPSERGPFGLATLTRGDLGAVYVQRLSRRPAGTSSVEVFFTLIPHRRRVRIVNVLATRRLSRRRERDVLLDAAATRAYMARHLP